MTTEVMLDYYKKEVASLTERCITAEADRDSWKERWEGAQRFWLDEVDKRKEAVGKVEFLDSWNSELLQKLDYCEEWINDHGGNYEEVVAIPPAETEEADEV